ncbi:class F sortase [Nocardia canadensis]|uniref:class F sortase n=1 Tax=Nocardia canadensis TaxID=3065238 RepID=UPI00292DEA95|nr:class F sortase [Nocardia canadensis]
MEEHAHGRQKSANRRGITASAVLSLRVVAVCLLAISLLLVISNVSGDETAAGVGAGYPAHSVAPRLSVPPRIDAAELARLVVPALDIDAPMAPAPTTVEFDPFLGREVESFGVPVDMESTTWWSDGPRPGEPGLAVVLGHTQVNGHGVFDHLGDLAPGDHLEVRPAWSGWAAGFRVREVIAGIPKSDSAALSGILSAHRAVSGLALITCDGRFDQVVGASEANTVVIAESLG